MEEEKKSCGNSKNILICILLVIIVALAGTIICLLNNKKEDKKPINNNQQENKSNDEKESNIKETDEKEATLKDWMTYILNQDITKIELIDYACNDDDDVVIKLNTNQLRTIFTKFNNYKLTVSYIGGSGWECGKALKVSYKKNSEDYELMYISGQLMPTTTEDEKEEVVDKDLESALIKSANKVEEKPKDDSEVYIAFSLYASEDALDEFFK